MYKKPRVFSTYGAVYTEFITIHDFSLSFQYIDFWREFLEQGQNVDLLTENQVLKYW